MSSSYLFWDMVGQKYYDENIRIYRKHQPARDTYTRQWGKPTILTILAAIIHRVILN